MRGSPCTGTLGARCQNRDGYDFTLGGLVAELEAVISESVRGQFVLVAQSATAPAAITYAASHPDQVIALVLHRSWLRGTDYVGTEAFETYRRSLEGDWRVGSEAYAALAQGFSGEERREGAARARELVEQATYLEYLDALAGHDSSSVAADVTVPTYVVGLTHDILAPASMSRDVARAIPGAHLELIDDLDAANRRAAEIVGSIVGSTHAQPRSARGFSTILFTDVVSSTPLLTQLHDERMRAVMRDHDAVCEAAITEHGGRVVKTIGDAFMAEFSVPSAAIDAAIAIQRGIREQFTDSDLPVRLRIGINAGEPIVEDDDLHGASVVIAKRLESEAETDGILVSDVVRQAVAGKDFEFEDRGEVELKGFDQPVRAWAVSWE